ncbi:NAD(P)/FAD-dependent oxidoreductase [Sulfurimonas sp. SAG-AH-194-L11]|nr:NAD(P)/FAD-dependent oxidoreductase [Sulfurimonas sp. SAG-AH-194-L11]MDF1876840.1 NAD(P)/FAD-dependent oxidoreductase [Sulfurimonas sp. SAG-AH-194-L11]
MLKNSKHKIIVIGGGYAGIKAIENLAKNSDNEIILLDKNPYHYMQTEVYDLIANEEDFAQITLDLFTYCSGFTNNNVTFCKQEVKDIDFQKQKVITTVDRLSYDYLVIGVGARTKFVSNVVGLREYAYGIKVLHRAMYFKQKFEMSLFKKVDESGTICTPLSIVIAGAGLSGVEIAAQMASFAKEFYKNNNFLCRKLNIILINAAEHILKGMDEKLVEKATKRLLNLEVVIKNRQKVTALTKDSVTLSSGEKLFMDFMIFAGGIEPNGLVYALNLQKNERGYIQTRDTLQILEYENVFAIGDCTTLKDKKNNIVAPTADIAEQMGVLCAQNIKDIQVGKSPTPHHIKSRGILIALGRRYATAKVFGIYINGYCAYLMKKAIEKIYAKRLDRHSYRGCKKIFTSK